MLDPDLIRRSPKVVLHDHLDGGLRPSTIIELAGDAGHRLPTTDPDDLAAWFLQGGEGRDLVTYLATFEHTVAVLQTTEALERVAAETVEDLADDGVVHAEIRYAPELSTAGGLTCDEVLSALDAGVRAGGAGREVSVGLLVCGMRQGHRVAEAFAAAARSREVGSSVVGVDLAGPEAGYPAGAHRDALAAARAAGLRITLHAGEADGPASIADALDHGAERLGHGVRIGDDVRDGVLGPVAERVRRGEVPLEVCPTSNVHTGLVDDVASHPVLSLREQGFWVTINTDNRLMSGVSMTSELTALAQAFDLGLRDLESLTLAAAAAAFLPSEERVALAARIERGFAALWP